MSSNSLMLGQFLPSSLLEQSTPLRRLTSTSSDSGDSGVDPSYRQERKIFVGGVPSSVGPEELANFFQSYGQVEEAFIIYDRYSGRHRGFGFVTFTDMSTTKFVCSNRIFHLHGRKIECKRALKREDILTNNEVDSNEFKSFRPSKTCISPQIPSDSTQTNIQYYSSSIPVTYGQYRHSPTGFVNGLGSWIINPSMQTVSPMFHPIFNPYQQYAVFPLSTFMWNNPYQPTMSQSPFIQEMMMSSSISPPSPATIINL